MTPTPAVRLFPEEVPVGAGAAKLRRQLFEMEQRGREAREGYASVPVQRAPRARARAKTA